MGVHRQLMSRWAQQLEAEGLPGLKKAGRAGRRPPPERRRLEEDRARAEAWAGSAGLRDRFVDGVAGGALDRGGMRGPLPCLAGLAHSAATGLELPASGGTRSGAGPKPRPAAVRIYCKAIAGLV